MARVRMVPRSRAAVYASRARQYAESLNEAVSRERWDAVALLASRLVIASVDAVTAHSAGSVWAGQDHTGAVSLLEGIEVPGRKEALRQIREVLSAKARVEYGDEPVPRAEAESMARMAVRIYRWSGSTLAPPPR